MAICPMLTGAVNEGYVEYCQSEAANVARFRFRLN
jgi:hypothetical protein